MGTTVFILMRGSRPWRVCTTRRAAENERRRLIAEGAAVLMDFEVIAMAVTE